LGFTVAAPIGPVNIAVIRRGLASGFVPAWLTGLGAGVADAIYVVLVFLGLAPFLGQSVVFRLVMWGVGGAFLIYLGASGMRPRAVLSVAAANTPARAEPHPFLTGFGITMLNPMTIVSWVAIGGAFFSMVAVDASIVSALVLAASVFFGSVLWSGSVALMLHFARRLINARVLRVVSMVASLALIVFGLGFFLQAVQTILG
jgi:threonine/homoserine/homoserine lactone efflux protein